jgi:hypothetical protein
MLAPPKHRFQFRLRTLLICVTLLCVVGGYVAIQARIVRERLAMDRELTELGCATDYFPRGTLRDPSITFGFNGKTYRPPFPSVSLIRRWLGDRYIFGIAITRGTPPSVMERARLLFPEADVIYVEWLPTGGFKPVATAKSTNAL